MNVRPILQQKHIDKKLGYTWLHQWDSLSLNNCNLELLKHFRHSAAAHIYRSCVHWRTVWKALDCRPNRFTDGKTGHTFSTARPYMLCYTLHVYGMLFSCYNYVIQQCTCYAGPCRLIYYSNL